MVHSSAPAPSKKLFIDNSRNRFFFLRNKTRLSAKVRLPVFPKFLRKFSKDRKNYSWSRDGKIFGRKTFLVLLRKKLSSFFKLLLLPPPEASKGNFSAARNVRLVCFRFCSSNDSKQTTSRTTTKTTTTTTTAKVYLLPFASFFHSPEKVSAALLSMDTTVTVETLQSGKTRTDLYLNWRLLGSYGCSKALRCLSPSCIQSHGSFTKWVQPKHFGREDLPENLTEMVRDLSHYVALSQLFESWVICRLGFLWNRKHAACFVIGL